jgi:magnesium chelatase family protein
MSVSTVYTRAQLGVSAPLVTVETHISNGLPSLSIVGMPEASVRESRERVRSALLNAGFEFPARRVTINLAPADLPKQGGRYDLAIAVGILSATGQLDGISLDNYEFIGELALTGSLRAVSGVLPTAVACHASERKLCLSAGNILEAGLVEGLTIVDADNILQVCERLHSGYVSEPRSLVEEESKCSEIPDMVDIRGQRLARRAMEVAAAGGLNLLLYGPPGTGKSMLASRLTGILPPLSNTEALEAASVYSVAGQLDRTRYYERPYRAPHHSASAVALIGGGSSPLPGEVSKAHHGVLFLDELPEFDRRALEMLREPIESGHVNISRANRTITFPAVFQLMAAMNPCPCGYLGHPKIACRDTPQQIYQYRRKLSGPLLDRFDMHVEVGYQSGSVLLDSELLEESSAHIKARVVSARDLQISRQGVVNSLLSVKQLGEHCALDARLQSWLENTMEQLSLSARGVHRVLRLARTVADLSGDKDIEMTHLGEAMAYRSLDKVGVNA